MNNLRLWLESDSTFSAWTNLADEFVSLYNLHEKSIRSDVAESDCRGILTTSISLTGLGTGRAGCPAGSKRRLEFRWRLAQSDKIRSARYRYDHVDLEKTMKNQYNLVKPFKAGNWLSQRPQPPAHSPQPPSPEPGPERRLPLSPPPPSCSDC